MRRGRRCGSGGQNRPGARFRAWADPFGSGWFPGAHLTCFAAVTTTLFVKLFAIFAVVGIGWLFGRTQWLSRGDPGKVLSNLTFYLFVPALLFRTVVRLDFSTLPWNTLAAYFLPVVGWLLVVYAIGHRQLARQPGVGSGPWTADAASVSRAATPAVLAICVVFSNTVQLGLPMIAALFGEAGLAVLIAVISVHALTLMSIVIILAERDLARAAVQAGGGSSRLSALLAVTARNTLLHPVVLPVLAGLAWNLAGVPYPSALDETLAMLGQAVIPLCLVVIGMSLAHFGLQGAIRAAAWISAGKLLVQPALVLVVGAGVFGLSGLPLAVIVLTAAMPVGANALLFAQRYNTSEAQASSAIVLSTGLFALSAPLWLLVLKVLGILDNAV